MTDKLIEQIKADHNHPDDAPTIIGAYVRHRMPELSEALARDAAMFSMQRARVSDMEARILADAEVIKAAKAKRDADAEIINAAHALIQLLESPSHSDGDLGRYHYDWFVIDQAIYAFNGAMQAQAAILRSYEVPVNEARMDALWDVVQSDCDGDITVGKRKRRTDQGEQR